MALDVAALGFTVDSSALVRARTDLNALADAASRTSGPVEGVGTAATRASTGVQDIIAKATGLAAASRTASTSTQEWVNELNRQAASFNSLRASVDPAFAAAQRYESAVEQVNSAVRAGIVTQQEANRVLDLAAQANTRAGQGMTTFGQATNQSAGIFQRYGHQIQNTSFQLQDVVTQISMGTDAMRAMSVQLPQMLGGFGAWGALIGVVVGVLGGLAPALFGAGNNADALKGSVESLNAALERHNNALEAAAMPLSDLTAKYGQAALEAQVLHEQLERLRRLEAMQALIQGVTQLNAEFSKMGGVRSLLSQIDAEMGLVGESSGLVVSAVAQLEKQYGLTLDQAREYTRLMDAAKAAKGPQETAAALAEVARYLDAAVSSSGELNTNAIATAASVTELALTAYEAAQSTDAASVGLRNAEINARSAADTAWALANNLSVSAAEAAQLAANLGAAARGLEMQASAALASVNAQISAIKSGQDAVTAGAKAGLAVERQRFEAAQRAAGLSATEAKLASDAAFEQREALISAQGELRNVQKEHAVAERAAAKAGKAGAKAGKSSAGGSRAAAAATRDLIGELNKELDARQALIGLYGEERARVEALQKVKSKLGDDIGKYTDAAIQAAADRIVAVDKETKAWEDHVSRIDGLTDDLAGAWGDWIAGGLRDFKDFTSAILGSFKSMISDMIATAVRNPIQLAITGAMGGMGGAGAAVAGVPGAGGAGMLGGIGAAVGGLASWGSSGAVAGFTGLMSGGVGGALTAVGTQAALAGGGLSSLAVGLGAIAAPVSIVAGLFSFFKKSTKELDRGLRVTVEGMDTLVETFTRTETRRFWGLSKKRKTDYDAADAATADPIEAYVAKMQTEVMDMAKLLGVGAGAFENFSAQIKLSTKDMTDEQAIQAIQAELTKLGDEFAGLVPGLAKFSAEGEGAHATLTRLSASLTGVNASLGALGLRLYDLSVNGAGAAAAFADMFGGLDQFQQAAGAYYQEFYSEAERMTRLQEVSTKALRDAGLAVPATREAYRALVEAQNLSTDAGRKAAAVLLQLAPAFDQMFDAAEAARLAAMQAIADANASRADLLDSLMTDQQRAVQAQAEITATFAALNMTVPTTLEGLRAIIAGLDLTGEAGRTALAQIAGIADELKDTLIPAQGGGGRVTSSGGGGSRQDNTAEERERLERQLLQLQGNTFELRQRELNALAPANRALQEMIWRLEDAKDAMDNLKTDGFATLVDFELARARQANSNAAPVALNAQETRQRQDSAILTEIRDYMFTVANNTHRAARETRDLRMLQEGTGT